MSTQLVYFFAHPVRAESQAGIDRNLALARTWLRAITRATACVFECSWLGWTHLECLGGEQDHTLGIAMNKTLIRRCDGIVTCGPRLTEGMVDELAFATTREILHVDFTSLGLLAPPASDVIVKHFASPQRLLVAA